VKHSPAPWSVHPFTGERCNLHEVPSESGNFKAATISIGSGEVLIGEFNHFDGAAGYPSPSFQEMQANARLAIAAPELLEALEAMLARDQRNTCQHEKTHRGGSIWEICNWCGCKWADDEGGKPDWVEPKEWVKASAAIAKAKGEA